MNFIRNEMTFTGKHADYLRRLKSEGVFSSAIEIVILAAVIGLDKNLCKPSELMSTIFSPFKIEADAIYNNETRLTLAYAAVVLCHDEESDFKQDADSFFRARKPEHMELFMSYIRGGLEYLYKKLVDGAATDLAKVIAIEEIFRTFSNYMVVYGNAKVQSLLREAMEDK